MSQAPHMSKKARSGARFGDLTFVDAIQSVANDLIRARIKIFPRKSQSQVLCV